MDVKRIGLALVMILVLGLPLVMAAAEYTQTIVHFYVPTTIAYTLTLYGQSLVTSAAAATATTDLYFNGTTYGSAPMVNASVVGGSTQDGGNAIFQFDNTGNLGVNITIYFNATLPTCILVKGSDSWLPQYADVMNASADTISTSNVTVKANFQPADAVVNYWLWANFSSCDPSANVDRILYSSGYN